MLRRTLLGMALVVGALMAGLTGPANAAEPSPIGADRLPVTPRAATTVAPSQPPVITLPPIPGRILETPQHTPDAKCAVSGGRSVFDTPYSYNLTGRAWYKPVPGAPALHQWFQFEYKLDGLVLGDHSNVTVRLYEAGTLKFSHSSGDDVRGGRYEFVMPSPIYTSKTSSVTVEFEATFDRARRSDPRCKAITGRS